MQKEIKARVEKRKDEDFLGFEWHEYLCYLKPADLRTHLKKGVTDEELNGIAKSLDRKELLEEMKNYMPFAWDKANSFRGISASRSISHYAAWTWLIGDVELSDSLEGLYEYYGKPCLVKICEHYDWDYSQWDDGVRLNEEP